MKILLKKISKDLFYDGHNRQWKKIGDRLYGYDPLRKTIYHHFKQEAEFQILPAPEEQSLKSSTNKVIVKKPIETPTGKIAPQDIDKPEKYLDPNEIAYKALVGGS